LKRFKRNRSGYLTQFQKGTSRDASKHGRNVGTAVFVQKGSTLKVMEEFNFQGKQTSFYKYCPGTFEYILVINLQNCCIWLVNLFEHQSILSDTFRETCFYYFEPSSGFLKNRSSISTICFGDPRMHYKMLIYWICSLDVLMMAQ